MLLHVRTRGKRVPPNEAGVSPALTPLCHRLVCHASGGKHAPVDRPLRRAMLINNAAFAALRWHRGPSRTGTTAHPPAATLRLNNRAQTPVRGSDRQSGIGQKNVHRAGRVSGGLLNPSGGARNRPRNKSVLAQSENELNHNFASGNEFCLTHFKKVSPREATLLRGSIPVMPAPTSR